MTTMTEQAFPVPILDETGRIPERLLPAIPPTDAAVAELVRNGPETSQAVRDATGDAVTTADLDAALEGFARAEDLEGLATVEQLNGKADRPVWVDVFYDPVTGWANPQPPTGGFRRFDSAKHPTAPPPPSLAGVKGDRWLPSPESPIWTTP